MLRYKHLRLDQEKVEKAKEIFRAKTETEAMDRALENVIERDQELLRRRRLMKRILELRKSLGKTREDSAEWIRLARQERNVAQGQVLHCTILKQLGLCPLNCKGGDRDEPMGNVVNHHPEALNRTDTQEIHISGLCKDHFVDGLISF